MFLLHNAPSVYLSGRLIYKMYDTNIDDTFNTVVLLRHPLAELAERILTLKHVRKFGEELLGARDMMTLCCRDRICRDRGTRREGAATGLCSDFAASDCNADEPVDPSAGGACSGRNLGQRRNCDRARTLSRFAIVGLRDRQDVFLRQLAELIGVPSQSLPRVAEFPSTAELAEKLKSVPEVGLLIEQDLEVYHQVKSAVENLLDGDTVASERCG